MAVDTSTAPTASLSSDASLSHKERRQSRHKKHDPFLELNDDAVRLPVQPPPSDEHSNGTTTAGSLLADLVLTPINMVSLLISLVLVDHDQRQWRLSQHASSPSSIWARLSTQGAEPYQDRGGSSGNASASDGSFTGWYTRKKHRQMAKLELTNALELRGTVLVALLAWSILGLLGCVYAVRRLYGWMSA